MTRIDTPLAPPADKPTDKVLGKTSSKDGDNRQAAFRSLLRQIGGQPAATNGASGKNAKATPGDEIAQHAPTSRHRNTAKEEVVDTSVAAQPPEAAASGEPGLDWQAILGGGTPDRSAQPATTLDLSAFVPIKAQAAEAPAPSSGKAIHGSAGQLGQLNGVALPTTAGLDLGHSNPIQSETDAAADPFAALSSLLDRSSDAAGESETADLAPIKMSVVTRETHFEPVARLSPVQQIATAIGEELDLGVNVALTETAQRADEPTRHSSGPLKVLHVKLEPEDLGTVVLKMRLVDKSLELEVVASRQETADLLTKDRDLLTRVLRGSGYTADVVAISTSTAADGGQMTGDNRAGAQASSGQAGAQAGGNRDSNNTAGGGERQPAQRQPAEGATHEDNRAGPSGSDLYL